MAGPFSVPLRDRTLDADLRQPRCDKHDKCWGDRGTDKNACVMISTREWLLKRNRLHTGKTG